MQGRRPSAGGTLWVILARGSAVMLVVLSIGVVLSISLARMHHSYEPDSNPFWRYRALLPGHSATSLNRYEFQPVISRANGVGSRPAPEVAILRSDGPFSLIQVVFEDSVINETMFVGAALQMVDLTRLLGEPDILVYPRAGQDGSLLWRRDGLMVKAVFAPFGSGADISLVTFVMTSG